MKTLSSLALIPNPSPKMGEGSFVRTCGAGNRIEEVA